MNDSKLLEPDTYAVVDVLGHQSFAGRVSEHVIGGTAFFRVDVPEQPEIRTQRLRGEQVSPKIPAFTKVIGGNAIYIITPCSEEEAREVAAQQRAVPLSIVEFESRYVRTQAPSSAIEASADVEGELGVMDDDCPF